MANTLIEEIEEFGEVRNSDCILRVESGYYVMEVARNILNKHRLLIEATNELRLEAHWIQFMAANRVK